MKKFNKKLGTIKHVQFIGGGGPKRAHNGMTFFMKDQMFLFLSSAFSQNMVVTPWFRWLSDLERESECAELHL